MTPTEFLAFRDHLENASGFESWQFRELELVLGHKRRGPIERYAEGSTERLGLEARFAAPNLWDRFPHHLAGQGYDLPAHVLERDFTQPTPASPEVQAVLVHIYRNDPAATVLCERFTDLDEGIQEWRYRHVKMVERTIGTKRGTGGSEGAEYLKTTLFKPLFPDHWAIRTEP
jgi:tryptophan 2,3-dioxygenase